MSLTSLISLANAGEGLATRGILCCCVLSAIFAQSDWNCDIDFTPYLSVQFQHILCNGVYTLMSIQSNTKMHPGPNGPTAELVGIEVAAAMLSISPWTIRRWVCDRRITSCKIGTRRLIPATEINRLISEGLEERDETAEKYARSTSG
jgi:excisionase family DNA binding protein